MSSEIAHMTVSRGFDAERDLRTVFRIVADRDTKKPERREPKVKTKVYTQSEVDRIIQSIEKKTTKNAVEYAMILTAWAAWDTIDGVHPDTVQKMLDFMEQKSADHIAKGEINVSDMAEMLRAETGIVMHFDKEYFK